MDGWRHQPLVDCGGRDKLLDPGFPESQDCSADIAEAGLAQLQLLEGGALMPSITRLPSACVLARRNARDVAGVPHINMAPGTSGRRCAVCQTARDEFLLGSG